MKALCFSDIHLDWVTAGFPRFEDVSRSLSFVERRIAQDPPDVVLFLGDMCDPESGPDVTRALDRFGDFARLCQQVGAPVYAISGNHDAIEEKPRRSTMTPLRHSAGVVVFDDPSMVMLRDGTLMALFPHPPVVAPYDVEQHARAIVTQMEREENRKLIVLSHLSLEGIVPGSESGEMARGRRDFYLPLAILDEVEKPTLILNGHYHEPCEHRRPGGKWPVTVVGSIDRFTFGEEENEPRVLVVEW